MGVNNHTVVVVVCKSLPVLGVLFQKQGMVS